MSATPDSRHSLASAQGRTPRSHTGHWPAPDHDLRYYAVYRSGDPAFAPSPQTFRANAPTPLLYDVDFDPEGIYYYRVVALDHAGNASDPSMPTDPISPSGTPGGSMPLAYDLGPLSPNPARNAATIRLVWVR